MSLKLNTASGGSITLQEADTASNLTLTVPAQAGSIVTADSSGNVGINTTSPSVPLDVQANSSALGIRVRGRASGDSSSLAFFSNNNATEQLSIFSSSTENAFFGTGSRPMTFSTNNTERMRIDSSGRVTTPSQPMASWTGIAPAATSGILGSQSGTVFVNIGGHFNSSTNQFTCPIAGRYRIQMNGYTGYFSNYNWIVVRKNGASIGGTAAHFNKASNQHIHVCHGAIVDCAANDTLDVYLTGGGGANEKLDSWFVYVDLVG
jgi:hypothetical protein